MQVTYQAGNPVLTDPIARISRADLDTLMSTLEVQFVALSECLVSRGFGLTLGGVDALGIHYNLTGVGRAYVGMGSAIELAPHTLIIVPPNSPFRIEATHDELPPSKLADSRHQTASTDGVRRFVSGDGDPEVIVICGFFHAQYASSTKLFDALAIPIVEQFDAKDLLDFKLRAALAELVAQEAGSNAMTSALLKQVIVALLRRSLTSLDTWVERFAMFRDPQIARAFAAMVANPGGPHSVKSLAHHASLSRSAFMARFQAVVGRSPMLVLRDVRMRQAARQLSLHDTSIEQVASDAGYESRSSFVRAFRKFFDCDPALFKARQRAPR